MKNFLVRLWKEEDGQDLIEYGLLLVLIALLSITSVTGIGTHCLRFLATPPPQCKRASGG